jgi:hypothetical protein
MQRFKEPFKEQKMANAKKDNNSVPVLIGLLNSDGTTPTLLKANAGKHNLRVQDLSTGSDLSGDDAVRDDNGYPVALAVSSADGVTPVPLYVDSNGKLLITNN